MEYGRFEHIIGIVVWFHPTEKEKDALRLYNSDLEKVIIVDNSAEDNRALCADVNNAIYMQNGNEHGIAGALNMGCREALRLGADWVLTMDQDSRWNQSSLRAYIEEAHQYEQFERVGIFSPFHDCDGMPERHHRKGRYELRDVVMCSGNLLRLQAWQEVNGFREDFFIDCVDDELDCHMRQKGWLIVRTNNMLLSHRLGSSLKMVKLIHHPYTAHPAWRYYYRGRNMLYMAQLYPADAHFYKRHILKELKRLCLYDWDNKYSKLTYYLRGLRDGRKPI